MISKHLSLFILCFLGFACVTAYQVNAPTTIPAAYSSFKGKEPWPGVGKWAQSVLDTLTLEEKVGQMLATYTFGYFKSVDDPDYLRLKSLIRDVHVGGISTFRGYPLEQSALLNDLQASSPIPLLIAQDMEWGTGMRVNGATVFPRAMAVGATRDSVLAYAMGRVVAREARALGIQQNYAPTADVNNNPHNPIINVRSFGEDPQLVATLSAAYIRGMQESGLIATAKHFPGHGDTSTDSHADLPILPFDLNRLDTLELIPFKKAIEQGVISIMVGHLALPQLEPDSTIPATLSPEVTTRLLRHQLGFRGLIVTDAMNMAGVTKHYGVGEAAIRAVEAGADLLLMTRDERAARNALLRAIKEGRLTEARIDSSVLRILKAKEWAGLHHNRFIPLEEATEHVAIVRHQALSEAIARRSLTLLRNDRELLPLPDTLKHILVVTLSDNDSPHTGQFFFQQVQQQIHPERTSVDFVLLDKRSAPEEYEKALEQADTYDLVLVPTYLYVRAWSGKIDLPEAQKDFLNALIHKTPPVILISFGNPYLVIGLDQPAVYIAAYSSSESSQKAVAQALWGRSPFTGKLPITIPQLYPFGSGLEINAIRLRKGLPEEVGMDSRRLRRVDTLLYQAIADSAFPGAALAIGRAGVLVKSQGYGYLTYNSDIPVTPQTLFDLASLTKVVGTTTAVMKLYEEGKIRLDDPVSNYLPEFGTRGKTQITIKHLLTHTGGLRAFVPFHRKGITTAEGVLQFIYQDTLQYTPGTQMIYSDFDMILLGKIVEKVTGMDLDTYLRKTFFEPLGMYHTGFRPLGKLPLDSTRIAPTEIDSVFRKKLVWGEVHDETAWILGGIAGHAGLFSTAEDLAIFAQMLLNGGTYGGKQFLKPETIRLFTTPVEPAHHTRALGWDTRSPSGYSSAGHFFGPRSFGHTGFTGTSIWIDPDQKLFVILLTNRVYPTRANRKIIDIRPRVDDHAYQAIVGPPELLLPEPFDWRRAH